MQERRYSREEGCKFDSEMTQSAFSFDVAVSFRLLNVPFR